MSPNFDPTLKINPLLANSNVFKQKHKGLSGHPSIRDYTDFLSEVLILAYQQPNHRINQN